MSSDDRMTITIEHPDPGIPPAVLTVERDAYGRGLQMIMTAADGHVIAACSGLYPGEGADLGPASIAHMFGHAIGLMLQEEDPDFADDEGVVLADDAGDWVEILQEGEEEL